MIDTAPDWLTVCRGQAPLVVSFPHTGIELPSEIAGDFVSPWLTQKDADWWINRLYDFAAKLGATTIHTAISRSAIDVNRNPSGESLYPGQPTTDLCPVTSFDGESLYHEGRSPDVVSRRAKWFEPYHRALTDELERLRAVHPVVVLYDCHSIRSVIPRLFDGTLPIFNIGTDSGRTCAAELQAAVEAVVGASGMSSVSNGRFRGGYIARFHGRPENGVHAIQMELACRAYINEPVGPVGPNNWPAPYDPGYAEPVRRVLRDILGRCLAFAEGRA